MKIVVLQDLDMVQAAFDHRIGAWLTVFLKQMPFKRTCIDTDAHGAVVIPRGFDHFFDALLVADVTGVNPKTGSSRFGSFDTAFIVKVNISNDWYGYLAHDLFQCLRTFRIGH